MVSIGGVVNAIPDSNLCLTSFPVLHITTCGYICVHQQVGQLKTMKEHIQKLLSLTYFP